MSVVASVLIPARNEEADIAGCLEAIAAQDVGAAQLEVILADGASVDDTVERAEKAAAGCGFGRFEVVDNSEGGIATGLNRALAAATAPFAVRVDARSRIEPHYVGRVVDVLAHRDDVGVVGGAQVPLAPGDGLVTRGIARALSNRFTTGLARYRRSSTAGTADTVWMGAFRTDQLRAVGAWDPALAVNEDYELNERYRAGGALVWFEPDLRSGYLPRRDLAALARQYFRFGCTKGERWARGDDRPAPRHLVLLAAPPLALVVVGGLARRRGLPVAAATLIGGLLAADAIGTKGAPAPVAVRASAAAATATFGGSWFAGVLAGWIRRAVGPGSAR